MPRKPETYGLCCSIHRCREQFDISTTSRSVMQKSEFLHHYAGRTGWVIGLDHEGQAHYACPEHAGCLFNPRPLDWIRPCPPTFRATVVEVKP